MINESEVLEKLHPNIENDDYDIQTVNYYKDKISRGEHRPILINSDNEIIDGNHTMTAYQELGIEPKEVYVGSSQDFLRAAGDIIKTQKSKNPGLDAIYKMIQDGKAKSVEDDEYDLKAEIVKLRGQKYLDGIVRKSNGHVGYWALKRIVDSLKSKQKDNSAKTGDNYVSDDEYKRAMKDSQNKKTVKHVHYDAGYETDESNEAKDAIRKELGESFCIIRGDKGYLLEASMSYLKRKTLSEDPTRAKKSKHVQSKYIGISKYGVLNFETTSETHSGVKWYQEVHFPSFDGFMNIVEQGDVIEPEDVKKAMSSDNIKISCDDPSFLYWAWKYMAWRDVYGLEKETRAPERNNTRLQGALCKHLYSVIELLNERRILELVTRDLNEFCKKKLGKSNDGYQDVSGIMDKELKANQYDYDIAEYLKDFLSQENYEKLKDGYDLKDLDLTDEEISEIEDAIKGMRNRSQFALRSDLEKQLAPAKRGRKIKRDDIKLSREV